MIRKSGLKAPVRILILQGLFLLGMAEAVLAADQSAPSVGGTPPPVSAGDVGSRPDNQASPASPAQIAVPAASNSSPVAAMPAGTDQKPASAGYSLLGRERSILLAEMNKSPVIELPPMESMSLFDEKATRVENLNLFDAMALALDFSYEVASSSANVTTTEYQDKAALGPLLPRLDLSYNTGKETSNPSSITKAPNYDRIPSDTHTRNDKQITLTQTLWNLPAYFERQRQNLLLEASRHRLSDTQESVAYDTLVGFLNLVQLRMTVVLAENYESDMKKLQDYMNKRVQAGGASNADLQRVKGRVINATSALIEAKGAYEEGLISFKRLTGVVPTSLVLPDKLLPVLPRDFASAMAIAVEHNDVLQAALRDLDSVVQERNAARSKFSPRLDLQYSDVRTYNAGGIAASDPMPNMTLYPTQEDKRAMFVLSWNLLDGGTDMMQAKALESKRMEYEFRAKDIQRKLEQSLQTNFNALHAVSARIAGVRKEMESNDIVLSAFNEQLFAANRSLLDILDAYQRQYNSRTELMRLMVSESTASLEMLRNMGQLQEGIVSLR